LQTIEGRGAEGGTPEDWGEGICKLLILGNRQTIISKRKSIARIATFVLHNK